MAGRQEAQPLGVRQPMAAVDRGDASAVLRLRIASRTSWWLASVQPHIAFFFGVAE